MLYIVEYNEGGNDRVTSTMNKQEVLAFISSKMDNNTWVSFQVIEYTEYMGGFNS